jgi:putative flippase GtrA
MSATTPATPAEKAPTLAGRLGKHFPGGQFFRYLCVGVFNTLFGYCTFATTLYLLNLGLPQRFLYLTVILASIIATPLNITVAYIGYKFFVFRTHGNYLREWLKCFAVYGTGMIPGLLVLSALTRLLQTVFHHHSASLHAALTTTETHLHGSPLTILQHIATGKAMAGYIAGAIVMAVSTIYSFIGHKKVTFRKPPPSS